MMKTGYRVLLPGTFAQVVALLLLVNLSLAMDTLAAPAQPSVVPIRIVAFGDSLTAGYMLPQSESFPAQLARALKDHNPPVEVVNAGVSGDTTRGALERLTWALSDDTDAVILELGANDALRGINPSEARDNLDTILAKLEARGIEVLLAGMRAPRNLGEDYARAFDAIYPELAEKHRVVLYPFFLEGVVLDPALNLPDGLHPNTRGVAEIVRRILPSVETLIGRVEARRSARAKG